jgi:hypothetical protein
LDVLAKRREKTHQPVTGKIRQPAVQQRRDFRLIDLHELRCGELRETPAFDHIPDVTGQLRLRQLLLRLGQADVR